MAQTRTKESAETRVSAPRVARLTELGALVKFQPARALKIIQRAIRDAGGIVAAAQKLGVDHSTLKRWLTKLGVTGRKAGRPRKAVAA